MEAGASPAKATVQKPVAIRYRSRKREAAEARPRSSGKRTLTCYLCSREFGTASLPLHEPKCLEVGSGRKRGWFLLRFWGEPADGGDDATAITCDVMRSAGELSGD